MIKQPTRRVAATLLAHPDDAEILCAGTLIRLADAGWEIHIATVG
jgi:LmbE family N-acetylglucosaminyl deacetylase